MIAAKLIECAKALAKKYPEQGHGIDKLISAVERIDREFDGDLRLELLTEASATLQRHLERARASAETKRALEELRASHALLESSMTNLIEAAKEHQESVAAKSAETLGAEWPTALPKKVTWH